MPGILQERVGVAVVVLPVWVDSYWLPRDQREGEV